MDKITKLLIFLQLFGLILGITALVYAAHTYDHDIRWNKILMKEAVFPVVRGEKYFNMKTLQFDWIDTQNRTKMLSIVEIQYQLLRDTAIIFMFITGIVIVNFMVFVHFIWNAFHRFKHYRSHLIVWLNAICGLLLGGLALILKLSNIDVATFETMKLLRNVRSNPSDVDIIIDEVNDHPNFNLLKYILSICLKQKINKESFFKIPGYDFHYGYEALTDLGFCPHITIKFGTALGVGLEATIMWIIALAAQMSICNDLEVAKMNQVGHNHNEGEVFGGDSCGFGNIADMGLYQLNFFKDKDKVDQNDVSRRMSMARRPYSAHFFSHPISSIHFPEDIATDAVASSNDLSSSLIQTAFEQSLAHMRNKLTDKFDPELRHLSQTDIKVKFKKTKINSLKIDDSVSAIHIRDKLTDEIASEPHEHEPQSDITITFKKTMDNSLIDDDSSSTIHENIPPMSNKLNDEISTESETKKRSKKKKKKPTPNRIKD